MNSLAKRLQGEVVAIHISDYGFCGITHQSCDFEYAVFEYKDKMYSFKHKKWGEDGIIIIKKVRSFHPKTYPHIVKPADGETIRFEKIVYSEDKDFEGIAFRWGDTWLFVFSNEYELILTRSSFDLSDDTAYPEAREEPALFC